MAKQREANKRRSCCHVISWAWQSKWFLWNKSVTAVQQVSQNSDCDESSMTETENTRQEKAETMIQVTKNSAGADKSLFHCKDQWALACRLKNAVIVLTSVSQPCQTHLLCYRSVALEHCLWMQWAHYRDIKVCSVRFFCHLYNKADIVFFQDFHLTVVFPTPPSRCFLWKIEGHPTKHLQFFKKKANEPLLLGLTVTKLENASIFL